MDAVLPVKRAGFLDHTRQVIELSKKEGLSDTFFTEAKRNLDYVCRKTKLTRNEAVFFSHFLDNADKTLSIYDIGKQLNLDNIETIKYIDVIESLENKKYIQKEGSRINRDRKQQYIIPIKMQKKVGMEDFSSQKISGLNTEELFNHFFSIFEELDESNIYYDEFEIDLFELIANNKSNPILTRFAEWNFTIDDNALFIKLCLDYLESGYNEFHINTIYKLFNNVHWQRKKIMRSSFENLNHKFFSLNILEVVNSSGFGDKSSFCFSQELVEMLDRELDVKTEIKQNRKGLVRCEDIQEKTLFFNDEEKAKLDDLFSLLEEDNFKHIQNRLSNNGMRTGFACLFSGSPGTGKTESVYQIARKTKRDIMMVDVTETKSKWFSESEKMTKAIFTRYRKLLNENEKAPILFFNEADAIFSSRRQLDDTRSGPGQTENALQNIILQEMEDLKGILICTTNLTQNFDKAFERRFLYKIEFEKPSLNVRKDIWKSIIPDLSDEDIKVLSASFDFSGGQIENIARKRSVDFILRGEAPALEKLLMYCKDESMGKENSKVIGFGV